METPDNALVAYLQAYDLNRKVVPISLQFHSLFCFSYNHQLLLVSLLGGNWALFIAWIHTKVCPHLMQGHNKPWQMLR